MPPAEPPAAVASSGGGNVTTSESGLVMVNGMAVDVPALQQRLVSDLARRGACGLTGWGCSWAAPDIFVVLTLLLLLVVADCRGCCTTHSRGWAACCGAGQGGR